MVEKERLVEEKGRRYMEEKAKYRQGDSSKGTTIKEALAKWEGKQQQQEDCKEKVKASDSKVVELCFQLPPIDKMDASLSTLANCEKLSLSSNMIEKIANLNGLKSLKILSLGRNLIKNLNGLEAVSDTLQELWISYNFVEKLKGIQVLKKLKVLYMSNNSVKDWGEFDKLNQLPLLAELVFIGNPLEEKHTADGDYDMLVTKKLPDLKKLDGSPIIKPDQDQEDED